MPSLNRLWKIERELYKRGFNVALEQAEDTRFYRSFRNQLRKALFSQIEFVAKDKKKVGSLLALAKISLLQQIKLFLIGKSVGKVIDFKKFLVWGGTRGGQAILDEIKIEGVFDLTNPELIDFFDDHSKLLIKSVDDFTAKWIAIKIQEGKKNGLGVNEIAKTLISEGKGISKLRAQRIAMNELINAMTVVELEAAKRYGIKEIIWRTSIDDRVCPICIPLEGIKREVGGTFPTPTGPVEGPPAHVGCRCFMEEVIPSNWVLPRDIWLGK